ncbi:MAG: hypothetical protein AVDCRST_MAG01-01-3357 [uncultured Rubrobacteraceae bacterium]|uniref:Uncharacterized protein n=1 Tax=uncultured Rubrobacteraceae bacterium TaxID=349277 RepID=A0A6J4Q853_9ACTN|nr:MAG: hypothetical protein AVDCRST_MAG01-01-3357 [uncultured Rubrobacteraceae bacterium]
MTIRYLIPAKTAAQQRDGRYAPERVPAGLPDYPDRDFFPVVSEGTVGGTRRKVEVSWKHPGAPGRLSSGAGGRSTNRPLPSASVASRDTNFLTRP